MILDRCAREHRDLLAGRLSNVTSRLSAIHRLNFAYGPVFEREGEGTTTLVIRSTARRSLELEAAVSLVPLSRALPQNLLLKYCHADADLQSALERVILERDQEIERPGQPISCVYFPEGAVISAIAVHNNRKLEVGLVGYEGMSGLSAVLEAPAPRNLMMVQSSGYAMRLPIEKFRISLTEPSNRSVWLRYAHVMLVQSAQSTLAAGTASLYQRLARWILMWQDRVQAPEFRVTHRYMAILLGVRRAGVTDVLHRLEGDHLIRSRKNLLTVVDRKGLMVAANGFYGVAEAEYAALFGANCFPSASTAPLTAAAS